MQIKDLEKASAKIKADGKSAVYDYEIGFQLHSDGPSDGGSD